ncbi:MAG TPA: DUF5020 family protein [Puia sp.]|nr:DUF5020 family protein [Puia sp.]
MKHLLLLPLALVATNILSAQELQLHYDPRHTLDPAHNAHNYPTIYFQYFKNQDSGKSFIKPGSFLLKIQTDLRGAGYNISQAYIQVSQSFRCWKPPVFLSLQYSGGLGVTEPKQYSYYINNAFSLGLSYSFQWKGAWLSAMLNYKFMPYAKPTHDPLFTLYWWSGYFHYKVAFAGDFSIWTENKDHGDISTAGRQGKRFFFFAEPQLWYNINKIVSLGTKINMYYHINTQDGLFQVYPTAAVRCKL